MNIVGVASFTKNRQAHGRKSTRSLALSLSMSFVELVPIKAQRARVRFEQFPAFGALLQADCSRQIVSCISQNFPWKPGFGCQRGFASVFVGRERKISKNDAQPRIVSRSNSSANEEN